jgi:hypothetical protein
MATTAFDDLYNSFMEKTNATLGGAGAGAATTDSNTWLSKDGAFGTDTSTGWLTGGASAISGIASAYTGMQGLKLAKESYETDKAYAATNLSNSAITTNAAIEDRQRARLSSQSATDGPSQYEGLDSYLARNKVSGKV